MRSELSVLKHIRKASARFLAALLLCALVLPFPFSAGADRERITSDLSSLSAKSAILIDADSLRVLAQKDPYRQMGEASTTKIMTALAVLRRLSPDDTVKIPPEAVGIEGSSVCLCEGELLSVRDLLYALLLSSANDAATALAIAASGSTENFAQLMNSVARELGALNTNFVNPHGLYDEDHYTTAYDLALISAEALRVPLLCEIFASRKATIPKGITADAPDGDGVRYLQNHNKMLSLYDGAIGIKTGFTKASGRCLVSAAERDGLRLIAVTLCAPNDWHDHTLMLDYGFENYERATIFDVGEFRYSYSVSGGNESSVVATNAEPVVLTVRKGHRANLAEVSFPQRFELAPIEKGAVLGELHVCADGFEMTTPLIAAYSVERAKKSKRFKFFWQN